MRCMLKRVCTAFYYSIKMKEGHAMIFEPKQITLKDGRNAVLRSPAPEDAAKHLIFIRTSTGETDFLVMYPEEYTMSDEDEASWIRGCNESPYSMLISCYIGETLAGSCNLRLNSSIKTRHRAEIGIAIIREFWNLGIGTAMFTAINERAVALGISVLELEYTEGNERAKHLYEKMGFRTLCEKPNSLRLKDGSLLSEFYMQKVIGK